MSVHLGVILSKENIRMLSIVLKRLKILAASFQTYTLQWPTQTISLETGKSLVTPYSSFAPAFHRMYEQTLSDNSLSCLKKGSIKNLFHYLVERLLKKLPDFRDVELEMVLYPFLTEYYQSIEDYKNASMIQSRWIDYLQITTT